jgi:cell division septation protein DedD
MPSKTETISKTKAKNAAIAARTAALPKIAKAILDQLVTGPMSAAEVNGMTMALKKALVERALGWSSACWAPSFRTPWAMRPAPSGPTTRTTTATAPAPRPC